MEIPAFTRKNLYFVNDLELRNILADRLNEIDKLLLIQANLSTILLSISIVEGIFDHLASVFKDDIKAVELFKEIQKERQQQNPNWKFKYLTIEEQYKLLKIIFKLPQIDKLHNIYHLFRDYRNFIHPNEAKKQGWPVSLSQAQMASGLLNTTIEQLSYYLFIEKNIIKVKTGYPDYYESNEGKVLHLKIDENRSNRRNSFILIKKPVDSYVKIMFELNMQPSSILNFVFNYKNDADFKMLRLDSRKNENPHYVNSILFCTQFQYWHQHYFSNTKNPPEEPESVQIEIDFKKRLFNFMVGKEPYTFLDRQGSAIDLGSLIKPNLQIGFFNESGPVKLKDLIILYS